MPFFTILKTASSGISALFPWMFECLIDRYSGVDHEYVSEKSSALSVLDIWHHIQAIPTYRGYQLYDR